MRYYTMAHNNCRAFKPEFERCIQRKRRGRPGNIGSDCAQIAGFMATSKPIMKLSDLAFFDDNVFKPVAIQSHIGRRPIAAFGNSDGDRQMLQWTGAGKGARFCLIVRHTDAEREWNYDVSPSGKLEKGLEEAKAKGWTVVSMKDDWKAIFPPVK